MTTQKILVVGLGNPGKKYERTRHNLGARVVIAFAKAHEYPRFVERTSDHARISKNAHLLALPTTFMNESGVAVRALVSRERIPLDCLLVVHDDKDIPLKEMKLQRNRSSAGHKGVQSIIDALGSQDFWRLRLGVGTEQAEIATDEFVLQPFSPDEEGMLDEFVLDEAGKALQDHLTRES